MVLSTRRTTVSEHKVVTERHVSVALACGALFVSSNCLISGMKVKGGGEFSLCIREESNLTKWDLM